jgi:acyl-CoA hydrolase
MNRIDEGGFLVKHQHKIITIHEALALVKTGDKIVVGMVASEPQHFLSQLHTIDESIHHINITNCLPLMEAEFFTNKRYANRFSIDSWFLSRSLRKAQTNGNISFIPNHLHLAGVRRLEHMTPDLYVGAATYPDEAGMISLSLSNVYEKRMLMAAKKVILEINPHFPRTQGDLLVHVDEVDFMVETDYQVSELPDEIITEKDTRIGRFIADYIQDGDCLQLGIGSIPNAVANALMNKKHLGVHTEMLTTGFMKLFQAGAIDNSRKQLHPGKMVCCFAAGTKELYKFLDHNPDVLIMDGHYVNNPDIIKQNDRQISINSTIEVDLTGQCCSESIGPKQFSGTGGQVDTATGAVKSKGGQSFIALFSTAMVTNSITGEKEEISKIVSQLKPGAIVSLSRNDVDHVVTEYGVASLRGTNIKERVQRLIAIAHPKFKDGLMRDAKTIGLI